MIELKRRTRELVKEIDGKESEVSIHSLFYTYGQFEPLRDDGQTNDLPTMVIALSSLGASGMKSRKILTNYLEAHSIKQLKDLLPENEWMEEGLIEPAINDCLGRLECYNQCVSLCRQTLKEEGKEKTLKTYLNRYQEGLYSYDFQVLIRLAYAYESRDDDELARALAFFLCAYQPLIFEEASEETNYPMEQLQQLALKPIPVVIDSKLEGFAKLTYLAEEMSYRDLFVNLEEDNRNFYSLRALVLRLCLETKQPMMANAFSAVHSLRILAPLLDELTDKLNCFYYLLQGLCWGEGAIFEPFDMEEIEIKDWGLIQQLAIQSSNPLTLRLVYSIYRESQVAPTPLYNYLAYRQIHSELG